MLRATDPLVSLKMGVQLARLFTFSTTLTEAAEMIAFVCGLTERPQINFSTLACLSYSHPFSFLSFFPSVLLSFLPFLNCYLPHHFQSTQILIIVLYTMSINTC